MGYNSRWENFPSGLLGQLNSVYYDVCFRSTKTILSPVMDSLTEALTESISKSVKQGMQEVLDPRELLGIVLKSRK